MMKFFMIVLIIFFSITKLSLADKYEEGLLAAQNEEYLTAFKLWKPLADKGDKHAQNGMGMLYHLGHGVKRDHLKASNWFHLSADQGLLAPMFHLGEIYESGGYGVEVDYKKAYEWYLLAAENGYPEAQTTLGLWNEAPQGGLKQSYKKAVEWYLKAAKNGDAMGQCMLSYRLSDGLGIEKNLNKSNYWYNLSIKQGYECKK